TGIDFSEAMLRIARGRAMKTLPPHPRRRRAYGGQAGPLPVEGRGRIAFIEGDAGALPFPEDSFDIVTVGYGLRNLADWKAGLREMHRVAKPGGRLLVLDFGKPENRVWRRVYFAY